MKPSATHSEGTSCPQLSLSPMSLAIDEGQAVEKVRSSLRPAVSDTNDMTSRDSSVLSLLDMQGPGLALRLTSLCSGLNHGLEHFTLVSEDL